MAGATMVTAMAVRRILQRLLPNSVLLLIVYLEGYLLPNDEQESDRLDIAHEMTLRILGNKLYFAPFEGTPQRVLDLATGTGIWAIDFGKPFSYATIFSRDSFRSRSAPFCRGKSPATR